MANEKRLIDANALNRILHPIAMDLSNEYGNLGGAVSGVIMHINNAPTIDAMEVVRCRDCVVPHNKYTGCPELNGLVTPPDFYCPFGKRKDSDGNG